MTKKDYVLIAKAVDKSRSSLMYATVNAGETKRCVEMIAKALAYELKLDNNKFNRVKFLEACGVEA